jgi:hypothetical protein
MGLWSSKQTRELTIKNPEKPTEVYVTEDALSNVIKSATANNSPPPTPETPPVLPLELKKKKETRDDKRLAEYEQQMLAKFNETTHNVEKQFGERYETLPVCLDLQASISSCYSENTKQPLKCSSLANEYIKCVEAARQKRLGLA